MGEGEGECVKGRKGYIVLIKCSDTQGRWVGFGILLGVIGRGEEGGGRGNVSRIEKVILF